MPTFCPTAARLAFIPAFLFAGVAFGEEPAPIKLGNADKSQLVVGDYYEVSVERGKVKSDGLGFLLKVTDDWLVLGAVISTREVKEIPYLSDLPILGGYLVRDALRTEKYIYWVPRAAARINSRTTFEDKTDYERFKGDEFKIDDCATVVLSKDNEWLTPTDGVKFRGGKLHFDTERTETKWSQPKGWRGLPIVNVFTEECSEEVHRETQDVPLDEVCSLVQRIPYKIENPLAADTRRFLTR